MGAMFRLSLRNIASNKSRFALTTFAVLLGVSFVVSSFVLTDGLLKTFDSIVARRQRGHRRPDPSSKRLRRGRIDRSPDRRVDLSTSSLPSTESTRSSPAPRAASSFR